MAGQRKPAPVDISSFIKRASALRSHHSLSELNAFVSAVTDLLNQHLATDPTPFIEHIKAAKEVLSAQLDDRGTKPNLNRVPDSVLSLILQVRSDAVTEHLPGGHYVGLALNLLASTDPGADFLAFQLKVSKEHIRKVAHEVWQLAEQVISPQQLLDSIVILLEHRLPPLGVIMPSMQGHNLMVGTRAIPIKGPQRIKILELLVTQRSIRHKEFEAIGVDHPSVAISRLKTFLASRGVNLEIDAPQPKSYQLQYATLTGT